MPAVQTPPREALELSEAVSVALEESFAYIPSERFTPEPGTVFDSQGRVPVFVIRPGVGKGRGKHLYEAAMLEENADKFAGWKMYVDHRSPAAKKAAEGLPRSLRDLGGRITETWWQPDVPADSEKGFAEGAVMGLSKPVPWIRDLIENDPEVVEASISATATGVRPVMQGGQRVWLVEGINDRGSVDWVTEAGAGGRIAPLLEAAYADPEEAERVLLESMSDDDVIEHLRESHPELAEAMLTSKERSKLPKSSFALPETEDYPIHDEAHARNALTRVSQHGSPDEKSKVRAAVKRRYPNIKVEEAEIEGGAVADTPEVTVTPEALQEALSQPETLNAILASPVVEGYVNTLVEARLEESREQDKGEREAEVDRRLALRDLRDDAHRIIRESKLPDSWQEGLRAKYELREGGKPTDALNVLDEVDDAGKVTKPAATVLAEAVAKDIEGEQAKLAEAAPTSVRSRPTTPPGETPKNFDPKKTGWGRLLQEAHIDPDKAFVVNGAATE